MEIINSKLSIEVEQIKNKKVRMNEDKAHRHVWKLVFQESSSKTDFHICLLIPADIYVTYFQVGFGNHCLRLLEFEPHISSSV